MKKRLVSVLYLLVGLINFAPIAGMMGAGRLAHLYGIEVTSPDLLLLLQHRALLFGIIGGFILLSVMRHELRQLAATMALISMAGYLVLAVFIGPLNDAMIKVAYIDVTAIGLLLVALVLERLKVGPRQDSGQDTGNSPDQA